MLENDICCIVEKENIEVIPYGFNTGIKGAYYCDCEKSVIGIKKDIETRSERNVTLCHELGHHFRGKREVLAVRYAVNLYMPLDALVSAYVEKCYTDIYSLAEYFDITPGAVEDAITEHSTMYGNSVTVGDYTVRFHPFKIEKRSV